MRLKSGRNYSGQILEMEEIGSSVLITIMDKFGKKVIFTNSEIEVLEEEVSDKEFGKKGVTNGTH